MSKWSTIKKNKILCKGFPGFEKAVADIKKTFGNAEKESIRGVTTRLMNEQKLQAEFELMEEKKAVEVDREEMVLAGEESTILFTSGHYLSGSLCLVTISLMRTSIRVKCLVLRSYITKSLDISFSFVASLMLKYFQVSVKASSDDDKEYRSLRQFWCKFVTCIVPCELNSNNIQIDTVSLAPESFGITLSTSSVGNIGYLVFHGTKIVNDKLWQVDFVSEEGSALQEQVEAAAKAANVDKNPLSSSKPSKKKCVSMMLEIAVTKSKWEPIGQLYYRVEAESLRELFINSCLEFDTNVTEELSEELKEAANVHPVVRNSYFAKILDNFVYDAESDSVFVRFIERNRIGVYVKDIENQEPQPFKDIRVLDDEEEEDFVEELPNWVGANQKRERYATKLSQRRPSHLSSSFFDKNEDAASFTVQVETLKIKIEARSHYVNESILQILNRSDYVKGGMFTYCSLDDSLAVAHRCSIHQFAAGNVISKKNEAMEYCYVVMKGELHEESNGQDIDTNAVLYGATYLKKPVKKYFENDFLGTWLLDDRVKHPCSRYCWSCNIVADSNVSLCCIPVTALLQYVGVANKAAVAHMKYFWKYTRFTSYMSLHPFLPEDAVHDAGLVGDSPVDKAGNVDDSEEGYTSVIKRGRMFYVMDNISKDVRSVCATIHRDHSVALMREPENLNEEEEKDRLKDFEPLFPLPSLIFNSQLAYDSRNLLSPRSVPNKQCKVITVTTNDTVTTTKEEYPAMPFSDWEAFLRTLTNFQNLWILPFQNVQECARIHVYEPNAVIFDQHHSAFHQMRYLNENKSNVVTYHARKYFYLILEGECAYSKKVLVPDRAHSPSSTPKGSAPSHGWRNYHQHLKFVDMDLGLHLFPGDFSFMDGGTMEETYSQAHHHRSTILKKKDYIGNKHLFGFHQHTLRAVSRTEVCIVPLVEISKSTSLFVHLLDLQRYKYPVLSSSGEHIVRDHVQGRVHEADKKRALKVAALEEIERKVNRTKGQQNIGVNSYMGLDDFNNTQKYFVPKAPVSKRRHTPAGPVVVLTGGKNPNHGHSKNTEVSDPHSSQGPGPGLTIRVPSGRPTSAPSHRPSPVLSGRPSTGRRAMRKEKV